MIEFFDNDNSEFNFAVSLIEFLVLPTFVLNAQGQVIIWNKACERLTGMAADTVLGTKDHWRGFYDQPRHCLADLLVQGRVAEVDALYVAHDEQDKQDFGVHAENWCVMPQLGNRLYLAIDAGPIYNARGDLVAVVETLRDMTGEKIATEELKRMATSDELTGLANRRSFDTSLARDLASSRRSGMHLSLVMVDVDLFKPYNDTYGHQAGDECLRQIGAVLKCSALRPADVAARYGGEEFALILPNTSPYGATVVARRVQDNLILLDRPHSAAPLGRISVSMGIASSPLETSITPEVLIAQADAALYGAKHGGRNRFVVHEP